MNSFFNAATPDFVQTQINETPDLSEKISFLANVIIGLLKTIDPEMDTTKMSSISKTLVSQEEIVTRLIALYKDVYDIAKRLSVLMSREEFDDTNKAVIQNRAVEIVDEQIFLIQQEVFFKIVNAKENAEGSKNEDGPAMFYPGVEKTKNTIIRHIQSQANQLFPVAVEICKSFRGIATDYANTEAAKTTEKSKYDTISQAFEAERSIRSKYIEAASSERLRDEDYLTNLVAAFESLNETYQEKEASLNALDVDSVQNFDQKIALLAKGCSDIQKRQRPLRVIQNMVKRFPELVKQLDFFAESHYQARAVLNVLEEVSEEMDHVFSRYSLESFTVISFLRHKLNGMSHMYECIHYYYATRQIETDITTALIKRFKSSKSSEWKSVVRTKLNKSGIPANVGQIHAIIAEMNDHNYDIHLAFLDYKESNNLSGLRDQLKRKTELIDRLFNDIRQRYQTIQDSFSTFLLDDLGATDIEAQFSAQIKAHSGKKEIKDIIKSLNMLLATKKSSIEALEREFKKRFSQKLTSKQITAAAVMKVRKEYLKPILKEVQSYSFVQQLFVEILKIFITEREVNQSQTGAENAVYWMVEKMLPGVIDRFVADKSSFYKKMLNKQTLTNRELMIAFIADNLSPHEMENFSRVLPGLPRNKMHLDTPYGRILLEISRVYFLQIQTKSGSVVHFMERVFEKRERQKLVSNIHLMFRLAAEPFLKKIQFEEKKIDYLITLQRWKYRKELSEIIRYWQYLIQETQSPGQGQRGYFRTYREEERQLITRYISPDQLNSIEHQLTAEFDVTVNEKLREVDQFIFDIIEDLFELFQQDERVKNEFEEYARSKKIQTTRRDKEEISVLETNIFVPNVKKRLADIKARREEAAAAETKDTEIASSSSSEVSPTTADE